MPLSPPAEREEIHTRAITCQGFRRADGQWDIEGRITDTKTYGFDNEWRGEITPGTPIHDMWIRVTVTEDLEITDVEAVTDHSPYQICSAVTPNYRRLIGARIKPGFTKKVQQLLGGGEGCTHLRDLLGPVATTAYQTILPLRSRGKPETSWDGPAARRPRLLDSCYAFRADGEIAKRNWPEWVPSGAETSST